MNSPVADPAAAYAAARRRLMDGAPPLDDLWGLITWRAGRTPDAVMAVDEAERQITFGEYRASCERVAGGLAAAGVGPDRPLAWMLPTWIEAVVMAGALARLGVVQVPLLPNWRSHELGFVLRQTGASHLVTPGTWRGFDYPALAAEVAGDLEGLQRITVDRRLPDGAPLGAPPPPAAGADAVRWVFFTSGTTSAPKGVLHSDATVCASALEMDVRFDVVAEDRNSLVFPFTHIGGILWLMGGLLAGSANLLVEAFSPSACRHLGRLGMTLASGGPAFWSAFVDEQERAPSTVVYPALRALVGGGAPKPSTIHDRVEQVLGVVLAPGYGLTECPGVAQSGVHDPEPDRRRDGRALDGALVEIVRPDGTPAAPGEVGEIRVSGPMTFLGYLDPDEPAFDQLGRHPTGDLGRTDERGILTVVGRLKDIIIRKGENISAKEVEDVLALHPSVADVAVVGLADEERGERCCAVVVLAGGAADLTLAEVARHCADLGLARYKTPEQLELVAELPRNQTGKVLKRTLQLALTGAPAS